jgi:Tfp pilus assembly protein PilN
MIRINLLPVKQAAQAERQRQELTRVSLALALLLILGVAIRMQQGRELANAEARTGELEEKLKALDSQVRDVTDLDIKKKALDAKLKVRIVAAVCGVVEGSAIGPGGVMEDALDGEQGVLILGDID